MPHKNDHSPTSHTDAMPLTAWLGATPQPSTIAIIWRLSLPYARAAALLAELHRTTPAVSAMGLVGETSVWLYLWQRAIIPGLQQRLLAVDTSAMLVSAEQIEGGAVWACGRALVRLLAVDTSAMLVSAEQIEGGAVWACGRALVRLLAARARTSERENTSAPRVGTSEV